MNHGREAIKKEGIEKDLPLVNLTRQTFQSFKLATSNPNGNQKREIQGNHITSPPTLLRPIERAILAIMVETGAWEHRESSVLMLLAGWIQNQTRMLASALIKYKQSMKIEGKESERQRTDGRNCDSEKIENDIESCIPNQNWIDEEDGEGNSSVGRKNVSPGFENPRKMDFLYALEKIQPRFAAYYVQLMELKKLELTNNLQQA